MRRAIDRSLVVVTALCALVAAGALVAIVFAILSRALPALDLTFVTRAMDRAGAAGGVLYHVIGTTLLVLTAALTSAPLAIAIALTHSVYLAPGRLRRALSLTLYALNGIPSILFGILGLIVFVKALGWGKSWLAGGILLGLMILPTVAVALIERIDVLPRRYVETALALGLRPAQVVWSVILPQTAGGLLTGTLLGVARAAGETAPILFTAAVFSGATIPTGVVDQPVLALPYHIFVLAQDSFAPEVAARVWGSAAVLLALVSTLALIALPVRARVHEEARNV